MNGIVNLIELKPGAKVRLSNKATAEVVSNPRDGVWVFACYLSSPEDPSLVGTEDMVFAQDIVEVLEVP
jgi:hypothetical protein